MPQQPPEQPAEFTQLREALALTFRGMDRGFAALEQARDDLGRAKADCLQAQEVSAAVFNGPGPRDPARVLSVYRETALQSQDPEFLKAVLRDAWRKMDWLAGALTGLTASGPLPGGQD